MQVTPLIGEVLSCSKVGVAARDRLRVRRRWSAINSSSSAILVSTLRDMGDGSLAYGYGDAVR